MSNASNRESAQALCAVELITDTLDALPEGARSQVLKWIAERYNARGGRQKPTWSRVQGLLAQRGAMRVKDICTALNTGQGPTNNQLVIWAGKGRVRRVSRGVYELAEG